MEQNVCQSCGMPMTANEHFGTNKDGNRNEEYCVYCFKDGSFTDNMTLDEMIEESLNYPEALKDEDGNQITREEATNKLRAYYPTLKRWRNN